MGLACDRRERLAEDRQQCLVDIVKASRHECPTFSVNVCGGDLSLQVEELPLFSLPKSTDSSRNTYED